MDRLKLAHDLAEVTKSKEEEFESLIREEVERREVRHSWPALPAYVALLQHLHVLTLHLLNPPPSPHSQFRRSCQR